MLDLQSVQIIGSAGSPEIYQNLKTIYTTLEGTVPFDRTFGIDVSIIDEPLNIAKGKLIAEYTQKTKKHEPRARVKEVIFEPDETHEKLIPKVVVEIDQFKQSARR